MLSARRQKRKKAVDGQTSFYAQNIILATVLRNQGRRFFLPKGSRRPYTLQSCTAAIGGCRHVPQTLST